MARQIQVRMLGEFTIQESGSTQVVHANLTGRSRRLWVLIAYLIVNRNGGVTPQELIDLLWSDSAGDNPMATLQNNVSRARSLLQKDGLKGAKSLFKYEKGMYYWAPGRKTVTDIDTFERCAKRFEKNIEPDELDEALATCQMYKGDFLAQATGEAWCINLRIYYQTLFTRLCHTTVKALMDAGRSSEAEKICMRAIELDPTSEVFSILLMRSLTLSGNPKMALDHYDYIKRIFESQYSVSVSNELELERAAALQALYGRDLSEASIRQFLSANSSMVGAFSCNNSVFREIVQLHMRDMQRSGLPAQIAAIGFERGDEEMSSQSINMRRLEATLNLSLRSGDPFTKMSSAQFLILLPGATYENGEMVVQRVMDRFKRDYPHVKADFYVFLFDLASFKDEMISARSVQKLPILEDGEGFEEDEDIDE